MMDYTILAKIGLAGRTVQWTDKAASEWMVKNRIKDLVDLFPEAEYMFIQVHNHRPGPRYTYASPYTTVP